MWERRTLLIQSVEPDGLRPADDADFRADLDENCSSGDSDCGKWQQSRRVGDCAPAASRSRPIRPFRS